MNINVGIIDQQVRGIAQRLRPAQRLGRSVALCYVDVMAIRRITISVPVEVAARIKKAAAGKPVSTWVTELVEERLDDAELERQWRAFYSDVGPTREHVRRAEAIFKRLTRRARRKGAA